MTDQSAASLLRHIEQQAAGYPRRIAVLDLWRAVESGGWSTAAFVVGLNQLLLEGCIELAGDHIVLQKRKAEPHLQH